MATLQVPLFIEYDNYELNVDLDNSSYKLEFVWNNRSSSWNMILKNNEGETILGAVPLVINSNLLGRFKTAEKPQGILTLYDISGANKEAGRDDLNGRCVLIYSEAV